jgi:hypothetical protein
MPVLDKYTQKLFGEYIQALKDMRHMCAALDFTEAQCRKVEHLRRLLAQKGKKPVCKGSWWELEDIPPMKRYIIRQKGSDQFWRTTSPVECTEAELVAHVAASINVPCDQLYAEEV